MALVRSPLPLLCALLHLPSHAALLSARPIPRPTRSPLLPSPHLTPTSLYPRCSLPVMANGGLGGGGGASLWPSTLSKFWGLHALAWAASSVALTSSPPSLTLRSGAAILFGVSNAALAFLLYAFNEDAGAKLSLLGALYFAGCAAFLHPLAASISASRLLRAVQCAKLWHASLALGSLAFGIKASLKDKLFTRDTRLRSRTPGDLPTLALINSMSGAKTGQRIAAQLEEMASRSAFGALQVADLNSTTPRQAIAEFSRDHPAYRILACGGDGTVTWILSDLEEMGLAYRPSVAVLPLGTGNDLARVLGWGKGVRINAVESAVQALDSAEVSYVDRWLVSGQLPEGAKQVRMANYMSIGCDAKAALLWARMARAVPILFRLRLLNKLWYIVCGTPEFFQHSYADLHERCRLVCNGKPIKIPKSVEGIMIVSTPSYGGGSDLWDEKRSAPLRTRLRHMQTECSPAAIDDGKLEVVGVTGVLHLATALGGISNGVRLCQGTDISVSVLGGGVPLQIDGEPYNIEPAGAKGSEAFDVKIEKTGQALMLSSAAQSPSLKTPSAITAIDRSFASGIIDVKQREALLKASA